MNKVNSLNHLSAFVLLFCFSLAGCSWQGNDQENAGPVITSETESQQTPPISTPAYTEEPLLGISDLNTDVQMEVVILGEMDVLAMEGIGVFSLDQYSPNGQWVYSMDYENYRVSIMPITDILNQQSVILPDRLVGLTIDIHPEIIGWAADSTGLLFSNYGPGGLLNPLGIVNIIDGVLQSPVMYSFISAYTFIYSFAWSPSGDSLYVFERPLDENLIRIYRFDRQMELQDTREIPMLINNWQGFIYPVEDGLLLISVSDIGTQIDHYSFQSGVVSEISHFNDPQDYYLCGISPDSQYALIGSYNLQSMNDLDRFLVLDLSNYEIMGEYYMSPYLLDQCIHSDDHSMVSFAGDNDYSERGLIIWNWNDWEFSYWPGDYYPLGWSEAENGFVVIDQSQEDVYTVEVLRLQ